MEEPLYWPPIAVGLPVIDVNGVKLGRVAAVRPETQELEVELTRRAARRLGLSADALLDVPLGDIIDADDHEVTLREEADFLAHPGSVPHDPLGE